MGVSRWDKITTFGGSSGQITVLLVDDDQTFLETSAEFLQRELGNVSITTLTDPTEVRDLLTTEEFDCIVSDYNMPEMTGLELVNQLREEEQNIPFILFTGKGSEAIASQAISAGVDEYLQKGGPEEYPILANKIENLVDKHAAEVYVQKGFQALESAQEGIAIIDDEGYYQYANEAYATVYDRDRCELIGTNWRKLYPKSEIERFEQTILPQLERDGNWNGMATAVATDGTNIGQELFLNQMDSGGHVCVCREK